MAALEALAQRPALTDQVVLPDELVEAARPHPGGEGLPLGRRLEQAHGFRDGPWRGRSCGAWAWADRSAACRRLRRIAGGADRLAGPDRPHPALPRWWTGIGGPSQTRARWLSEGSATVVPARAVMADGNRGPLPPPASAAAPRCDEPDDLDQHPEHDQDGGQHARLDDDAPQVPLNVRVLAVRIDGDQALAATAGCHQLAAAGLRVVRDVGPPLRRAPRPGSALRVRRHVPPRHRSGSLSGAPSPTSSSASGRVARGWAGVRRLGASCPGRALPRDRFAMRNWASRMGDRQGTGTGRARRRPRERSRFPAPKDSTHSRCARLRASGRRALGSISTLWSNRISAPSSRRWRSSC